MIDTCPGCFKKLMPMMIHSDFFMCDLCGLYAEDLTKQDIEELQEIINAHLAKPAQQKKEDPMPQSLASVESKIKSQRRNGLVDSKKLWRIVEPTMPGWYWARRILKRPSRFVEQKPEIVKVGYCDPKETSPNHVLVAFPGVGYDYDNLSEFAMWCGPLEPPEYTSYIKLHPGQQFYIELITDDDKVESFGNSELAGVYNDEYLFEFKTAKGILIITDLEDQ